ncbi:unnamed protein product [Alternaria alternata]
MEQNVTKGRTVVRICVDVDAFISVSLFVSILSRHLAIFLGIGNGVAAGWQNNMSITGAGAISGYIFDDISTGVLSIPSFYQDGLSVAYFFDTIDEFIRNATTKEAKRVVIDL